MLQRIKHYIHTIKIFDMCTRWGTVIAFAELINAPLVDRGYNVIMGDADLMSSIEIALQYKITSPLQWHKIKITIIRMLRMEYQVQVINMHEALVMYRYLGKK